MTGAGWRAAAAVALGVALVIAITTVDASAQCAMCRQALNSPEGRRMIAAFQDGILLLLAAPAGVFGVVATLAVRAQRRRQRAESDSSIRSTP